MRYKMRSFALRNCRKLLKSLVVFTPPPPPALRHNRGLGFTLVELLVGAVVGTMLLSGSAKFVEMSLQSSNVAKAVLAESDFEQTIKQGLRSKGCNTDKAQADLKSAKLVADSKVPGSAPNDGIGALKPDFSLPGGIKKDGVFKGSIKVVKMELRNVDPVDPTKRKFVVYYKKIGLGNLNAPDPDKCISTDVTGCFEQTCQVNYDNNTNKKHCTGLVNCHPFVGGGSSGPPPCYKVDDDSTTGKTLVGCGGTKDITATGTTAIGYNAGQGLASTGTGNTFLGVGAGFSTLSGQSNVFVGYGAGGENASGSNNTFIGQRAGYNNPDATGGRGSNNIAIGSGVKVGDLNKSNQINIGNIIKAEQKTDTEDSTKTYGVLKVCKADGSDCITLGGTGICETPGEFIREIKEDGTIVCAPACSGGRRLFETIKLEHPVTFYQRKATYDLRNPYTNFEGDTVVSRTRRCQCPDGEEKSITTGTCVPCGAGEKTVFISDSLHRCMYCNGGSWVFSAEEGWKCNCPHADPKKKKLHGLVILV